MWSASTSLEAGMVLRIALLAVLALGTHIATPLGAQAGASKRAPAKSSSTPTPSLIGNWQGTASVPLKDSTLTVPVFYTFVQNGSTIGGTAMVPGQGSGPISNVVITGQQVRFVVTATAAPAKPVPGKPAPPPPTPKALEHDGAFTSDGAIEGFVNLDKQPVAKFRIAPAKAAPARK